MFKTEFKEVDSKVSHWAVTLTNDLNKGASGRVWDGVQSPAMTRNFPTCLKFKLKDGELLQLENLRKFKNLPCESSDHQPSEKLWLLRPHLSLLCGVISEQMSSSRSSISADINIQGSIQFAVNYIQKLGELQIFVVLCRGLATGDAKKNRSDPWVLYINFLN